MIELRDDSMKTESISSDDDIQASAMEFANRLKLLLETEKPFDKTFLIKKDVHKYNNVAAKTLLLLNLCLELLSC